jgi:glycosyltransferase involved in cell wall biosynthesis
VCLFYIHRLESFGIPMLEAMSCNIPVITSNTSSMPEVSWAAHSQSISEEITQGLIKIVNDEAYRKSLCSKGLKRCKIYLDEHGK